MEPFKQSVTGCMRAIAQDSELEVVFTKDKPGMTPGQARLPEPGKSISKQKIAITRGLSDSMALRRAMHDRGVHATLLPEGENARAIFDAVEQARVEAVGARAMAGMGDNLAEMLEDKSVAISTRLSPVRTHRLRRRRPFWCVKNSPVASRQKVPLRWLINGASGLKKKPRAISTICLVQLMTRRSLPETFVR